MKLWPIFLGAWLVIQGLVQLLALSFRYDHLVTGVLALVAGLLVIIRK